MCHRGITHTRTQARSAPLLQPITQGELLLCPLRFEHILLSWTKRLKEKEINLHLELSSRCSIKRRRLIARGEKFLHYAAISSRVIWHQAESKAPYCARPTLPIYCVKIICLQSIYYFCGLLHFPVFCAKTCSCGNQLLVMSLTPLNGWLPHPQPGVGNVHFATSLFLFHPKCGRWKKASVLENYHPKLLEYGIFNSAGLTCKNVKKKKMTLKNNE